MDYIPPQTMACVQEGRRGSSGKGLQVHLRPGGPGGHPCSLSRWAPFSAPRQSHPIAPTVQSLHELNLG